MEKFLGGRAEDLRGRRVSEIFAAGHPLRAALRIEGDHIESVEGAEVTLERGAGQLRIGVSAQVIREHGKRMGALVTLHDIETLERIGNQLQVSERLAALGRVTAGVAHEVKNPLNSMRLWLEVLKANMPIDPEPQQAVKMLDSEIDRLDRAVKTFLNFTKPVEINLEETDLHALIEEVLDAARPAITKAGLELKVEAPENLPPVLLDRQLIHQCLLNLLLNASSFTPPGGRITVGLERKGEYAAIAVSDTGKGISPEDRGKIFQLFFTTRPGGTGIGLANTFRFVQLHNGRIEFESEVGRGTTFRVELPLGRMEAVQAGQVREFTQPLATEKRLNAQPSSSAKRLPQECPMVGRTRLLPLRLRCGLRAAARPCVGACDHGSHSGTLGGRAPHDHRSGYRCNASRGGYQRASPGRSQSEPPPDSIPAAKAPRKPVEQPVTEATAEPPARPPAPQISPQLSPVDQASYQRKTNDDVSVAKKNLQAAQGKQLNIAQQDLAG